MLPEQGLGGPVHRLGVEPAQVAVVRADGAEDVLTPVPQTVDALRLTLPGDTRLERRGQHWLWLKGRMNPGVEVEEVRAELDGIDVHRTGGRYTFSLAAPRSA